MTGLPASCCPDAAPIPRGLWAGRPSSESSSSSAFQSLTAPGLAVPTAPTIAGASPTPAGSLTPVGLPNHQRTPGAINSAATQANLAETVCKSGWAASVRPPSGYTGALKVAQILEYGYADKNPTHYQEDHLVPLELGGAPRDPRNLWPQPNEAAAGWPRQLQQEEGLPRGQAPPPARRSMTLDEAQRAFARDWIAAWMAAGQTVRVGTCRRATEVYRSDQSSASLGRAGRQFLKEDDRCSEGISNPGEGGIASGVVFDQQDQLQQILPRIPTR